MTNEELERRVAALEDDHRLTRWYTGRVDHDLAVIAKIQGEHTRRLVSIETTLDEHTGRLDRVEATLAKHTEMLDKHTEMLAEHTTMLVDHSERFDSVDAQLRSLTTMVGEVLNRLPEPGRPGD